MSHAKWLLVAFAVFGLLPLSSASAVDLEQDADRAFNMQRVAHIAGAGGTDLEFFSRMLTTYKTDAETLVTSETPVERHFAMVGNQVSGAKIVDITNPEAPFVAGAMVGCTVGQGDIQVNKEGTVAAIAKQGSGSCRTVANKSLTNGSAIIDLADPYNPIVAGVAIEARGSHNNTMHPSGKYLYISTSTLAEASGKGRVPIFDISDPYNPVKVKDFTWDAPNSPHDIRFSDDGKRAYFAGISVYHIVNTEDPTNPSIISRIVPPGGTIGHDTLVTPDKAFLFLGDEAGGGGLYPCPGGAIYVYDIRVEAAPVLLGAVEAGVGPVTGRTHDSTETGRTGGCTAHVMALNPDKKSLTLGWYVAGTRIFDFSSLYDAAGNPRPLPALSWGKYGVTMTETAWIVPEVGTTFANTWSAKQYEKVPCYVFSDDLALGLYVSKVTTCTPPAPEPEPSHTH